VVPAAAIAATVVLVTVAGTAGAAAASALTTTAPAVPTPGTVIVTADAGRASKFTADIARWAAGPARASTLVAAVYRPAIRQIAAEFTTAIYGATGSWPAAALAAVVAVTEGRA
jgi:hypothetical protein